MLSMFVWFCAGHVWAQTIQLEITGLRNQKGQVCVGIFKCNASFRAEKPYWNNCFPKRNFLRNDTLRVNITLEKPGIYGLSILDDENNDVEMQMNILGFPLEGFGFSSFVLKGLRRPNFSHFAFELSRNEKKRINIRMQYGIQF